MEVEDGVVLREAAGEMRKGDQFEQVLGRVTRRHSGSYADYVRLISQVREVAREKGLSLVQAAKEAANGATSVPA